MQLVKFIGGLATVGLLCLLVLALDPGRIGLALVNAPGGHILAGLALVQLQIVLSALRWRFTAQRLGLEIATSTAIREYYIATFLNQILPGGVAGDVVRAARNRTEDGATGWKVPAQAVIFERLSGQIAFFALTGLSTLSWFFIPDASLPEIVRRPAMIVTVVLASALAVAVLARLVRRHRLVQQATALGPVVHAVFIAKGAWQFHAGCSGAIFLAYLAVFAIAAHAVGAPLPLVIALAVFPLCLLAMLMPATVGGWGAREAAAAALWPIAGYTAADGVAAGVLYGLISLAGAAPGAVFLLHTLFARRRG